MNEDSRRRSRIVVALDPTAPDALAVDLIRQMMSERVSELLGLFVEDIRLLEHAQSRLAREIVFSGVERALDLQGLERQIRAQSVEVRRRFEAAASQLGLPHAFRIARGDVVTELTRMSRRAEALVLSVASEATGRRAWWGAAIHQLARAGLQAVVFVREGWKDGTCVLVIVEHWPQQAPIMEAAMRLAARSGSELTALLVGEAAAQEARLLAEIGDSLKAQDVTMRVLAAASFEPSAIIHAARSENARMVILPSGDPSKDELLVQQLLSRVRSALMLMG